MKKVTSLKNAIKVSLLSLLLIVVSFHAKASHFAAADMHIDYVGTGPTDYTYKITLNLYKACEWGNASLPTATNLDWKSLSGCGPSSTGPMTLLSIDTLDKLCDTFKAMNSCRSATSTFLYAFVRHRFEKVVTLSVPCPDWVFSWEECCRNAGILNINPNTLYIDAMINNSKKANVNTPRYLIDPIPYFCINVAAFFPNGPFDPDADSMLSINLNPRTGAGALETYKVGTPPYYSLTYPIDTDPAVPYAMDPTTGTTVFKPTQTGKFVLAFKTYDYDRTTGEILGYTTRDVQVSVVGCVAPPPSTDSLAFDLTGCYVDSATGTIYACPGSNLNFDLGATSNSTFNSIYAKWDVSTVPGASFTSTGNGTSRCVGTFNWTPTKSDVGDHVVSLRFADSTCSLGQPLITETYKVLKIKVLDFVNGGPDGIYCIPGAAAYQMKTKVVKGMRYKWTSIFGSPTSPVPFMDDDTLEAPRVRPAVLTSYLVEGSLFFGPYRCTTRDTVNVSIGTPLITIDAGIDQTVCANKPISLKSSVTPLSDMSFLSWSPASTLDDSTKLNAIATPFITTWYVLYAQDKNGCGYTDTAKVIVDGYQPLIAPYSSKDTVCPEGFTQLFANVSQQPCGIAQTSCSGGIPEDKLIGTSAISSLNPTPFFHTASSAGERMQILYRRDELLDAGVNAGFINSMSFNIPTKNSTDSFYKFTIKMTCTADASLSGSTMTSYPGMVDAFPAKRIVTNSGWNDFVFPNAYYWDGASNLVVEICWSKISGLYGGTPDPVYTSNTGFTSVKYIPAYSLTFPGMGEGCILDASTPLLSSTRPNTRFNVCVTSSLFKFSWTPTSYLDNPDSANTNLNGIKNSTTYGIRVTATSNPNCYSDGIVPITVDKSNSVQILPADRPIIHCRPGYFDKLDASGIGLKPLRNLACGTADPLTCGTPTSRVIANPATGSIVAEPNKHAFNGNHSTAHTQYIIPKEVLRNGNITSGTIKSIGFEVVGSSSMDFTNLKIGLKCTDTKQFNSTPPVSFETGIVPVYSSTNEASWPSGYKVFDFTTPYNWDTSMNLLIDLCYAQASIGSGPSINNFVTPGFNLMAKSYQTSGDVCSNPSTEIGPISYEVLPNFQVNFCSAGDTDFTFLWTPGNFFEDSSLKKPLVYIGEDTRIFVTTRGRNGCLVKDSVNVIVPKNTRFITQDTIICLKESIQLRSYNGIKTKWFESTANGKYDTPKTLSCDTCERAIAKPSTTTTYYAAVTSIDNCIDTFRTSVTVKPLPTINITNRDTTIKYGKSVILNVFGGTQYYWTPLAGLSNPNNVNPTATPLVNTMYRAVGVGTNGCRGEDSINIKIDYKSPISVPSAFTPDGDGKNDRFRILGVTFQTLTEFRVFNRWGQEVFSTKDINDGWDGTFNGKPLDMGAYNYIIRVGFPDGGTETYKGDVTLIR